MGNQDDSWQRVWDARADELAGILGVSYDNVYHAVHPLLLGGQADVIQFPPTENRKYWTFVTADLSTPDNGSVNPNDDGTIGFGLELEICTEDKNKHAADIISKLATYIVDGNHIEWGHSMSMGNYVKGSTLGGLLFIEPRVHPSEIRFLGGTAKLILLVGITADELKWAQDFDDHMNSLAGAGLLTELLFHCKVAPVTSWSRASIFNRDDIRELGTRLMKCKKENPEKHIAILPNGDLNAI